MNNGDQSPDGPRSGKRPEIRIPFLQKADADPLTNIQPSRQQLREKTVKGAAWTFFGQGSKFVLGFASTVILARLLTPEDFGLVAMVAAFTGLITQFRGFGLSQATVQRKEITHEQVSFLFWLNVALGVFFALLYVAMGPFLVWFYDEPRLFAIAVVSGISMIISSTGKQHLALMHRAMRFDRITSLQIAMAVTAFLTGVLSALLGAGYWSLIYAGIASSITSVTGAWLLSPWRPSLPKRNAGAWPLVSYGGFVSGTNMLNYVARNSDNVLIGKLFSAADLGLYTRAYSLLLLPIRQIAGPLQSVAISALARLQDDPERYRPFYARAVESTLFLLLPIVAFTSVTARELVLLALGDQWTGAIRIYLLIIPAAYIRCSYFITGWAYESIGHVARRFRINLVSTSVLLTCIFVGANYGVEGVAMGVSVHAILMVTPNLIVCYWGTFLRLRDLLAAVWRPVSASLLSAAAVYLIGRFLLPDWNVVVSFLLKGSLYGVLYFGFWFVFPGGTKHLRSVFSLLKELRSRKMKKAGNPPKENGNSRLPEEGSV